MTLILLLLVFRRRPCLRRSSIFACAELRERYGGRYCGEEIYGFVDLNGAGKTTTIRMLIAMIPSDGGQRPPLRPEGRPQPAPPSLRRAGPTTRCRLLTSLLGLLATLFCWTMADQR